MTCDSVCAELYRSERAPAPKQLARKCLLEELYRWRRRAGRLLPAPRFLGTVALGIQTAYAGWQIGTALRRLFVKAEVPAQPTPRIASVEFMDQGSFLLASGATSPATVMYAPHDGLLGRDAGGTTVYEDAGTGFCSHYGALSDGSFGGFGSITANGQCSSGPTGTMTFAVAYRSGVPLEVEPYAGQATTEPSIDWPTQSDPGTNGEATTTPATGCARSSRTIRSHTRRSSPGLTRTSAATPRTPPASSSRFPTAVATATPNAPAASKQRT